MTYDGELITADWKNNYVVDDCSKFAAAVYYHYLNNTLLKDKNKLDKDAYGIDLWTTGSSEFNNSNKRAASILIKTKKFELIDIDKAESSNNVSLLPGDLLFRVGDKSKGISSHVEFYIGKNKVVGWGHIERNFYNTKGFNTMNEKIISNYTGDFALPFTNVIRLRR